MIDNISKNLPTRLVKGYVYMCATADNLASKEIWCWLDESVKEECELQISLYKHDGATEIYCRQAFWDKIRLIALGAGSEYLASMVCGPVMPDADTLVTFSNLVDAGAAAYDYYACCHYAIP